MAEKAASAVPPVSTKAGVVQPVRATVGGGQTGWLPALRVQRLQELAGNRATSDLLSAPWTDDRSVVDQLVTTFGYGAARAPVFVSSSQIPPKLTRPASEPLAVDQGPGMTSL